MNEKDSPSLAPGFTSTEANATEDPYFETSLHEVEVPQNEPVKAPSPPPKPRGNPMRWLAIAAVLGVLAYIGIAPRIRQSHELSSEVTAIKDSVPEVQEVSLSSAQPTSDLSLPSNIQAIDSTTVDAQTVGYLKTRYVDIGSVVKKGELLAIVASPETDQQVGASLAEVAKSRSGVSQAEADVSKGQAGVAAARAVVIQDKAAVSQSRADLAGLKADQARVESSIRVAIAQQNEAKTRLDSARAVLAREQSGYTIADKTLRRWQELFKQQAVPGQEVDEKQADFDSATARVAAARSGISTAEADLEAATESIQVARAQLDAAKANVQSGTHKVSLALATVDAANAAVQASYATVRAGTSGVSSAQAVVTADQANAQRYEAMQGFERIVAPFSGVITARNVDEGDLVGPSSSSASGGSSDQTTTVPRIGLFGLAKIDQLRIQLQVPQTFSQDIRQGQEADVTVPELPRKVFHGHVFKISGALDSLSRTLLVEVRLPNPTGELKPGSFATVKFQSLGSQGILIPANTLIFDANGTRVVVLNPDDTIHYQPVKEGRDLGGELEIVSGLSGNEKLVANPATTLVEGQKVKPLESAKV